MPATEERSTTELGLADAPRDLTLALRRWSRGDAGGGERVFQQLYSELRRTAVAYFSGERSNHTLQPTALVNEAFLRLAQQGPIQWTDRRHFLSFAARIMRQVLIDHSRLYSRQKRGAGCVNVPLALIGDVACPTPQALIELHQALERLATWDPQKASMLELHFFGGLDYDEIAHLEGVSRATVGRQMRRARAWLYSQLLPNPPQDPA
ncbi:MAG: ECF-type sigma factor [Acidobacteriota bacterium]